MYLIVEKDRGVAILRGHEGNFWGIGKILVLDMSNGYTGVYFVITTEPYIHILCQLSGVILQPKNSSN